MNKQKAKTILILGGYGNFGKRIAENLTVLRNVKIVIAGRSKHKAEALVAKIKKENRTAIDSVIIDCKSPEFHKTIQSISPFLTINTCGPFQGQDYKIAEVCLEIGSHYIDLADDRRFVCDITSLNNRAKQANLLIVSGVSTVPGLSSVVVDYFQTEFKSLESIDMAIAPGNKAERGEATIGAILSYTGKPFKVFVEGKWQYRYGWLNFRKINFGGIIGKRRLANVDVPELELFPQRYPGVKTVTFQAGLELGILHWSMIKMAYLVKFHMVKSWSPMTKIITRLSYLFDRFGTDKGGMRIKLIGTGLDGKRKTITWSLFADHGIGPQIPTIPTIILARNLVQGSYYEAKATPCLGMYSLEDFNNYCQHLDISYSTEITHG